MALGTNQITQTTGAVFIPEIWLNEIRGFLKAKLVMGNVVKTINHNRKAGDILHIPDLSALTANDKAVNTQVTLQSPTETEFTLTINKHKEASFLIEDFAGVQSNYALRSEYTRSAGYAIAKQQDTDIIGLGSGLSQAKIGGDGATAWDPTANTNTGNGTDLTDAGIRAAIELLDNADVPPENRALVIHPSQKNVLLGINRFTEQAFYGEASPIHTGEFGEIYGVKVFVTTQVPSVSATDTTTLYRRNLLLHRDAFAFAEQITPRIQSSYILEYLGNLTVVDTVYGVAEFRDNHGISLYTPA